MKRNEKKKNQTSSGCVSLPHLSPFFPPFLVPLSRRPGARLFLRQLCEEALLQHPRLLHPLSVAALGVCGGRG